MAFTYLTAGLLIFFGIHSIRVFADPWRSRTMARVGEGWFKGVYAVLSLAGFMLMMNGYGQVRPLGVVIWNPPEAMRYIAALLTLVAFILLAATYVPKNTIKTKVGHPMVLGTALWALAHLLVNGGLANMVLFGGFLLWAGVLFVAARARDRRNQTAYPPGTAGATLVTVGIGVGAWAAFAFWLHKSWVGVAPFAAIGLPG